MDGVISSSHKSGSFKNSSLKGSLSIKMVLLRHQCENPFKKLYFKECW